MKSGTVRDKHLKLDQHKIEQAKNILKARTETETIEKALELVIATDAKQVRKRDIQKSILDRRRKVKPIKGTVADLIHNKRQ